MLKKLLPGSLMLFGGPEVSFEGRDFFEKYPFADYLIKGEGEVAICDAADGKYSPKTIIDGGIFDGFGNSTEPYFSDGNDDAFCDGKLIYYESSRGCPYNCSYCLSSVKKRGEKLRFKPADVVKKEIAVILSHNVRTIKFVDRTFNADKERAKELFSYFIQLSEKYMENGKYKGPALHFEICAALLDDACVEILSIAPKGLFQFEIWVQTITPQTLLAIGRNDDTQKILANVRKLREKTNITVHLDLICGLPLDTYGGIASSFDAIYGLCDCIQVGILKILPGTKMIEDSEKYGIKYLDNPPYTVLESSTASFDDLRKLSDVGECAEKFCKKDNPWYSSIKYMVSLCISPFGFFEKLCFYLENFGAMPPVKIYSALYAYAKEEMKLNTEQLYALSEYVRYDYLLSQQGSLPAEFHRIYNESETTMLSDIKHKLIHSFPKGKCPYFIPATEIHLFGFDASNAYVIDRKNRISKKIKL